MVMKEEIDIDLRALIKAIMEGEVSPTFANKVLRLWSKYQQRGEISFEEYQEELNLLLEKWRLKQLKRVPLAGLFKGMGLRP